jgi:protein Shroom
LEELNCERLLVNTRLDLNEALGQKVTSVVERLAKPYEYSKFKLHIEDIDKITCLLFALSTRLAKAEHSGLNREEKVKKSQKKKSIFF